MSTAPKHLAAKPARLYEIDGSIEDIFDFFDSCYEKGWTDGLPVYPPTEARVADMLRYTDRAPGDIVGIVPPRNGAATVEKIAINAVMAGCRPEYLPVLITAIEAMVHPDYNLYGRQTTTHPGAHLMIVHGPIRKELDVNCRQNLFGHGWRANATLGRAIRLVMINVGGNKPGVTDMATHGHPGKFTYTMGEDEENSPWPPFHVDRGFTRETSAVTMLCAEAPHNINDQKSHTVHKYLGSAASSMSNLGSNGLYRSGLRCEHMLLVPAESANWMAEQGWSKSDVSSFIFEHARKPIREMRDRGGWDMSPLPKFVDMNDDDALVPIVNRPQDILVVVGGGHQRHMNAILTSGYNLSVTRAVTRKDGTPIKSVRDFLR
ncbi:MAG TPA: hypothetical protein VED01_02800 [Burkholderiales bacterium]|nr:hypothetical protein [Burkholderiales bacterium]